MSSTWLSQVIADDVAELQLRAEVVRVAVDGEAERQRPGQQAGRVRACSGPTHPRARSTGRPCRSEVLDKRGLGRIAQELCERPFAVVVVLAFQVDDGLPFHVRLAGEDEDLERFRRIGLSRSTGNDGCREKKSAGYRGVRTSVILF